MALPAPNQSEDQDEALLADLLVPGRSSLDPGPELEGRFYDLVGHSFGSPGGASWVALLFPTLVQPKLTLPAGMREIYRSVEWTGRLSNGSTEVRTEPAYVSVQEGVTELGLRTVAEGADGRGESLSVLRVAGTLQAFGERALPSRPEVGTTESGFSMVIDLGSLKRYTALVGMEHPTVDSESAAQQQGLPNRLIPSAMLLLAVLKGDRSPTGSISMWFRRPVPVGTLLNLGERPTGNQSVGRIRLPNGADAAIFSRAQ